MAESTHAQHWVRLPLRGLGRNPYVWNAAVEGVEQQDDAGGGSLVVPNWDGYRLARAGRFLYWNPAPTEGSEAFVEGDNITPFLVRVPLRGLGRNPYLQHGAQDLSVVDPLDLPHGIRAVPFKPLGRNPYLAHQSADAPAEPDSLVPPLVRPPFRPLSHNPYLWHQSVAADAAVDEGLAPFVVRRPFRDLGRSPYLWTPAGDEPPTPAEAETLAPVHVRRPFRELGRSPYLWSAALDEPAAAPAEPETPAPFLIRPTFRPYARRPDLGWAAAGDVEGPVAPSQDVGTRLLVVRSWDGLRLTRAGRFAYWGQAHDEFVAPPPETDKPPHFIVRIPFRRYGRNPYLHHRDWQDGPPPPTFVAAWARNANVLLKAGLVP